MAISKAYLNVDDISYTQKHLMCIMGLLLPPVPFFLMTGPNYTFKTKEFFICVLLMIVLWFAAIIYAVWFVYIGFDEGRKNGYQRLNNDPERREPATTARAGSAPTAPTAPAASDSPVEPPAASQEPAEASLPSYEESEEAHPTQSSADSKPLGDHKIQH
ncbi:hypothetical protein FDK38_001170 [Candidozyma auris]|nr:hypothetical protein FDK38_001170 [[Candida] auris]